MTCFEELTVDRINVGGYETVTADRKELSAWITGQCLERRTAAAPPAMVFSSNGQGIALRGRNPDFDRAMRAADVVHADGMSVVMASRLLAPQAIRERSATTDLFHDVARDAVAHGLNFYVLGGTEDQNRRAVHAMLALYPDLRIVGRRNGYFGRDEDAEVCRSIVAVGTDVLWVGLGKPLQETWSHANRGRLHGVGCIKTCGGLYSYLTGDAARAPLWMQRTGLEWLFRLAQEPNRLMRRYLVTNTVSAWRLLTQTGSRGT